MIIENTTCLSKEVVAEHGEATKLGSLQEYIRRVNDPSTLEEHIVQEYIYSISLRLSMSYLQKIESIGIAPRFLN